MNIRETLTRLCIRKILADPVKRRELLVECCIGLQAMEGITTTREQAEAAYDRVQQEKQRASPDMVDILACVMCGKRLPYPRTAVDTCGKRCFKKLLKQQRSEA